jgi:hypothetical protein
MMSPGWGTAAETGGKLDVLIVDGRVYGRGPDALKAMFTATGRFNVEVSTSPSARASQEEWEAWRPRFSDFDAVVFSSYQDPKWSDALRADFEVYVNAGGGAIILHTCVGAFFEDWDAYLNMLGVSWRRPAQGYRIIIDDATGEVIRIPPMFGVGVGHSKLHFFLVKNRLPDHPIMRGIPDVWLHGKDELYHGLRGPAENIDILASAYSAKDQWGSGDHEPVLWTVTQGKGRVVVFVLGHDLQASHCVGYQTLIARGVEWAATGAVTIPVPQNFPTKDKPSVVKPEDVLWSSKWPTNLLATELLGTGQMKTCP